MNKNSKKRSLSNTYNVQNILDKKIVQGRSYYLIEWEGYPLDEATWEPRKNLSKCMYLIYDYEKKLKESNVPVKIIPEKKNLIKEDKKTKTDSNVAKKNDVDKKSLEDKKIKTDLNTITKNDVPIGDKKLTDDKKTKTDVNGAMKNIVLPIEDKKLSDDKKAKTVLNGIKKNNAPIEDKKLTDNKKAKTDLNCGKKNDMAIEDERPQNGSICTKKIKFSPVFFKNGRFEDGDIGLKIIFSKMVGEKGRLFAVQWEKNQDGTYLNPTFYSSEAINKYKPSLLLDYYESKIKFLE